MRLGAIALAIVGVLLAPSGASAIETYSSSPFHQTIAKAVVPDRNNEPLYVGRCQDAYDAAKQVVDGIAERAAAAIVEQLEEGQAPKTPTPTANASREKAEGARADLEHAITARAELAGLVGPAERAVAEAESQVKEAARGVIRLRMSELRAEIDAHNAQMEARRQRLNALLPTLVERRWEVPWPVEAAALLTDPEAELDRAEPAKADAAA